MVNPLDAGVNLGVGALASTTGGAVTFPLAWPLARETFKLQSNPGAMYDAGVAWAETAREIRLAAEAAEALGRAAIASGWEGTDCDAFIEKLNDYVTQLYLDMSVAIITGIAMIAAALMIFAAILMVFGFGATLLVLAATYWSTVASVVGAPAAPALFASYNGIAGTFSSITMTTTSAITAATTGFAAAIEAFLIGDVAGQAFTGNPEALDDLVTGTVESLGTVALGTLSLALRDKFASKLFTGNPFLAALGAGGGYAAGLSGPDGPIFEQFSAWFPVNAFDKLQNPEDNDGEPDPVRTWGRDG